MKKFIIILFFIILICKPQNVLNVENTLFNNVKIPFWGLYYSGWSCLDCFTKLEKAIKKIDKNANIVTIVQKEKSIVIRKKIKILLKNYIESKKFIFVTENQILKLAKQFPELNNYRTPGLFYFGQDTSIFIEYDSLFNKKRTISKLAELIKGKIQ